MEEEYEVLGGCMLLTIVCGLSVIYRGFVLSLLWSWFLTPIGLPHIGITQALGLSMTIAMLTYHPGHQESIGSKSDSFWETIGSICSMVLVVPTSFLCCGWVLHLFL